MKARLTHHVLSRFLQRSSKQAATVIAALFFCVPVRAQTSEVVPPTVNEETPSPWFGRSFDRTSQFIILTGLLGSGVATSADHTMRDQWKDHQKMDENTAQAGDILGSGAPGALIAIGQYVWDRENGLSHAKSLVAATVWSTGLKVLVNRKRPSDERRTSWPSGHTTTSFTTATSLAYAYGWEVGLPAYFFATGVGLSRMADDVHWFSDVVAGAFIGIWMGRAYHHNLFTSETSEKSSQKSFHLVYPSLDNGAAFINVLSHF